MCWYQTYQVLPKVTYCLGVEHHLFQSVLSYLPLNTLDGRYFLVTYFSWLAHYLFLSPRRTNFQEGMMSMQKCLLHFVVLSWSASYSYHFFRILSASFKSLNPESGYHKLHNVRQRITHVRNGTWPSSDYPKGSMYLLIFFGISQQCCSDRVWWW